jgi:hypothetical protein
LPQGMARSDSRMRATSAGAVLIGAAIASW